MKLLSLLLKLQLRLVKPIASKAGIAAARKAQDKMGALGARAQSSKRCV